MMVVTTELLYNLQRISIQEKGRLHQSPAQKEKWFKLNIFHGILEYFRLSIILRQRHLLEILKTSNNFVRIRVFRMLWQPALYHNTSFLQRQP